MGGLSFPHSADSKRGREVLPFFPSPIVKMGGGSFPPSPVIRGSKRLAAVLLAVAFCGRLRSALSVVVNDTAITTTCGENERLVIRQDQPSSQTELVERAVAVAFVSWAETPTISAFCPSYTCWSPRFIKVH